MAKNITFGCFCQAVHEGNRGSFSFFFAMCNIASWPVGVTLSPREKHKEQKVFFYAFLFRIHKETQCALLKTHFKGTVTLHK